METGGDNFTFTSLFPAEAVFLFSLRMSSFPVGSEVYGKSIESSFLAGNELAPSLTKNTASGA